MADEIKKIQYNGSKGAADQINARWWEDKEPHEGVIGCCRAIEGRQQYRRARNVINANLYSNQFLAAQGNNIYARPQKGTDMRLTLNVIKACIDTATAKIAKNKPRPLFLTQRGNWDQRQRAKKLTQYNEGVFKDANIYPNGQKVFRDAGIFGTGFIKLQTENDRIESERILPDEVIVDDTEAIYGMPRCMYHRRFMPRDLVLSLWGTTDDMKHKIAATNGGGEEAKPDITKEGDMIYVVEAWHLPSGPKGTDGRHAICFQGGTFFSEPYTKNYFPIFPLYWTPPVVGFYGNGIVEEIAGIQFEVNKLLRDIQQGMHKVCAPSIWIENSTHVAKPVTNEIGSINRYSGQPPTFYAPSAFSSEVYNHVWNLYRRAFEIVGISELSATLKKPAGLESRAALREYNEIETERFAIVAQSYENFYMDVAMAVVDMSRDLYKKNKALSVNVPGKKFIESIEWAEVDMERDSYVMEVFPTAILPSTPSGKLDRVQDLIEGGLIAPEYAKSLLDFPDLENVVSLETASFETISMMIDNIIYHGKYQPPEQFLDLGLLVKMAQQKYCEMMQEDVPADRMDMLQRFMKQGLTLMLASESSDKPELTPTPAPLQQPASPIAPPPPEPMPAGAPPAPPAPGGPPPALPM